ncbi:hypothetical protein GCM10023321_38050 [Pseudonocardia eucalypti]|uniref:Putative restriction endonuclease domain-containing protein n=1 Tax=Pseudonocardia eucalypti TaxID=648755 RepID=A0ABP9Q8V4_9PSEU|nr:Uma2 family endonuclease [Pseudonocardia eucalypti]
MAAVAALDHPLGPYTVDEWLTLPPTVDGSTVELIYGYLHVSPAPSTQHQRIARRLTRLLEDAVEASGRPDLEVLPTVNVRISTAWRTALIPDVVVLTSRANGVTVPADLLALAVEVWSPGNSRAEQETKTAGYATAGVPFLWTVSEGQLVTHRLVNGQYEVENRVTADAAVRVTAAPVAVTVDFAELTR